MENYTNAVLIRIDDSCIFTAPNGEKFLVIDKDAFNKMNGIRERRVYTRTDNIQTAILEILRVQPKLTSGQVRTVLKDEYKMEPTLNSLRAMFKRMKDAGLLELEGTRNASKWSVKKPKYGKGVVD